MTIRKHKSLKNNMTKQSISIYLREFAISIFVFLAVTVQAQEVKTNTEIIADTYWRNESTGDWFIGFAPNHVIFNNKVWAWIDRRRTIWKEELY